MWMYLCVILFAIIIIHYVYCQQKMKDFPGPTPIPLLGNALDLKKPEEVITTLMKYKEKYGSLVKFQLSPFQNYLLITDYDFLQYLLTSQDLIDKSGDYDFLLPWIGAGLLISTGQRWKLHRRMITPAFHFSILESFINVFEANGDILIDKMLKLENCSSINVFPMIKLCALDVICETAMGTRVDAQINENSQYVKAIENISYLISDRIVKLHKMNDFIYSFSNDYQQEKKELKFLHDYTIRMIEERKRIKKLNPDTITDVDDIKKKKKKTFIDILIQEENNLILEEIEDEVDTFLFEGHDTTSSIISFALYILANHPDVQEKILEEQKSIFGDNLKSQHATYRQLQEMHYLEAVIKESLRIYPPVPQFIRKATRDIEHKGKLIPAGTNLWMFAWGMHRNPEFFSNPDVFDPERFLDQNFKYPFAFIPFSAGPRNCIGQKFAMLLVKSIISKVVRNFILKPSIPRKDVIPIWVLVLKSVNGIHIRWEKR